MKAIITYGYKPERNTDYTQAQKAEAIKLQALIDTCANDLAKLSAVLEKAGYGQDSIGQWFKGGVLVPQPGEKPLPGIGVSPYAS